MLKQKENVMGKRNGPFSVVCFRFARDHKLSRSDVKVISCVYVTEAAKAILKCRETVEFFTIKQHEIG